jgi:hypothetical protein
MRGGFLVFMQTKKKYNFRNFSFIFFVKKLFPNEFQLSFSCDPIILMKEWRKE